MLGLTAFSTPGRDCGNICFDAMFFGAIGTRSKLDKSVQGHLHPGALLLGHV